MLCISQTSFELSNKCHKRKYFMIFCKEYIVLLNLISQSHARTHTQREGIFSYKISMGFIYYLEELFEIWRKHHCIIHQFINYVYTFQSIISILGNILFLWLYSSLTMWRKRWKRLIADTNVHHHTPLNQEVTVLMIHSAFER